MTPGLAGAVVISVLALSACSRGVEDVREGRDVVTKDSPDGRFRARLREVDIDGSVMVSQPYQVVVTSLIHPSREPMVMLTADKTSPLELTWEAPATLLVCYSEAHIYNFRNVFFSAMEDGTNYHEAEVVLRKSATSDACTGHGRS